MTSGPRFFCRLICWTVQRKPHAPSATPGGIDFKPEALEWDAGARHEGSWYGEGTGPCHDTLRKSTTIQRQTTAYPLLEEMPSLVGFDKEALPLCEHLLANAFPIEEAS